MATFIGGALPRTERSANACASKRVAMPNWLEGRHALITGGGTGIGAAAATHLNAAGAKITVAGPRIEPLDAISKIVGGTAIQCDVTSRDEIARAFDEA